MTSSLRCSAAASPSRILVFARTRNSAESSDVSRALLLLEEDGRNRLAGNKTLHGSRLRERPLQLTGAISEQSSEEESCPDKEGTKPTSEAEMQAEIPCPLHGTPLQQMCTGTISLLKCIRLLCSSLQYLREFGTPRAQAGAAPRRSLEH